MFASFRHSLFACSAYGGGKKAAQTSTTTYSNNYTTAANFIKSLKMGEQPASPR